MKWWGWGDEGVSFSHDDKPGFKPFLGKHLGIDVDKTSARPLAFDELDVPAPQLSDDLRAALERAVGEEHVSDDPHDRIVHARGKSLRDLVRQRRGDLGRVPDVVVRPGDETAVVEVLQRRARGRRGRDPVRRRHEHLRQPRGAAARRRAP